MSIARGEAGAARFEYYRKVRVPADGLRTAAGTAAHRGAQRDGG
jgi:hypothetical protein